MPKIPINYTNKDFSSIKKSLVEYTKNYYPDTYKDFNQASFGSLLFDLVSLVGDQLSFYADYNFNESNIDTALEVGNVRQLAKLKGYKIKDNSTASGKCAFYVIIPAASAGNGPNLELIPILKSGTGLKSQSGVSFVLAEDVDFSKSDVQVTVAEVNTNGAAISFAFKAYGSVISGEFDVETSTIDSYEKFLRIKLEDKYIQEIISIFDSQGNQYYQVDYLSQDVIFQVIKNKENANDSNYILKPFKTARKFIVDQDEFGYTYIQFGYGSKASLDDNKIPEASEVAVNLVGKNYFQESSFDPSNLMKTDKFGIVPVNTTLTIAYRKNSSNNNNIAVSSLSSVSNPIVDFSLSSNYTKSQKLSLISQFEADNEDPIVGDSADDSLEDIRIKAKDFASAQFRAVTKQDYTAIIYQMPAGFGSIKRVNVVQDKDVLKRNINLFVVSEDTNGYLVRTPDLSKKNLKTWIAQYKMINDTVDILDANIINIGIKFYVIGKYGIAKSDIMVDCLNAIKELYQTKMNVGEPLFLGDVYKKLNLIPNVVDTKSIVVQRKYGINYSGIVYDVDNNLSSDERILYLPEDSIFEIKYPNQDIIGVVE